MFVCEIERVLPLQSTFKPCYWIHIILPEPGRSRTDRSEWLNCTFSENWFKFVLSYQRLVWCCQAVLCIYHQRNNRYQQELEWKPVDGGGEGRGVQRSFSSCCCSSFWPTPEHKRWTSSLEALMSLSKQLEPLCPMLVFCKLQQEDQWTAPDKHVVELMHTDRTGLMGIFCGHWN